MLTSVGRKLLTCIIIETLVIFDDLIVWGTIPNYIAGSMGRGKVR